MLSIAVSSRALFDLEAENRIFDQEGWAAFDAHMRAHEQVPLQPGVAFRLIQKLLALNAQLDTLQVSVLLLSSNTLDAGARVMNSVRHYGLDIKRAFFTSGGDRFRLARAVGVTLFLSTNPGEVRRALEEGIASARLLPGSRASAAAGDDIRLAFDGDAVLFSDEAEQVNQAEGLDAFIASEQRQADVPLAAGPFKPVLQALRELQQRLQANMPAGSASPVRIALVTARGVPVYDRVLRTFRAWQLKVDESFFCDGMTKGPLLEAFGADLFFDDGLHNAESAAEYVPSGHVPHGVVGSRPAVEAEGNGDPVEPLVLPGLRQRAGVGEIVRRFPPNAVPLSWLTPAKTESSAVRGE